jgi:hypothetical protein
MARMQPWIVVLYWCINVLILSFALAIFEIVVEKENGWASGWNPRGAGRKLFSGSLVAEVCEKPYLTAYHLFVYVLIIPLILGGELLLMKSLGTGQPVFSRLTASPANHFVMNIGGVALIPILFLIAAWLSILVVEDLLWFLLNWYYPTSMSDLFSGKIWWHTRWLRLGPIKLPRFYVTTLIVAASLLGASFSPLLFSAPARTLK